MALSFPLAREAFLDTLRPRSVVFDLERLTEVGRTRGGTVMTREIGPALWRGEVRLGLLNSRQASKALALIRALEAPGASFLAYRPNQIGPAADPLGTTLGASVVTVTGVNGSLISLGGLPAGYELTPGDYLSFDYGSNPVRLGFHEVIEGVSADGAGDTAQFQIGPTLRPGLSVGTQVRLVKPYFKAVITPGSVNSGTTTGRNTSGVSFAFQQSLG
jgi:hypothetical protein